MSNKEINKEIICFSDSKGEYGCLCNSSRSPFTLDGVAYSSMSQYMEHQKALLFGDKGVANKVLSTDNPEEAESFGRCVGNYDDVVWHGLMQVMAFRGLYAKFGQNPVTRGRLLATVDAVLAYCPPDKDDIIWGTGFMLDDRSRQDISSWKGRNLLGFTLMYVRGLY